jgi:hypothetical protein
MNVPRLNRLAREKSPYLLQHAQNPVDWYPWGPEAFTKARQEDKPIFLSIGYSTCHWCHVMERESFADPRLAEQLNAHFVSIKVDREERPDLDKVYLAFVQATTGQGGWPLNVFLLPDLRPFFGGTYFPPNGRGGRPGFRQVLEQIRRLWETRRDALAHSAQDLHERLRASAERRPVPGLVLGPATLQNAARHYKAEYDPRHGGFGTAPKFPRPSQPAFLLRYGVRAGDRDAERMVLHTCERMAAGGLYDQLGGGFARYSVDAEWGVPHFEKMLYDNAQLVSLYLDAWLVSGDRRHLAVVQETLGYVLRDLTHPDGGFYSAEDADSEGHEGKFYCWTRAELARLLEPAELSAVTKHCGLTERGNFIDHSHPQPLRHLNVLRIVEPNLTEAEQAALTSAKAKMFTARSRRVRPRLDDKVLASWNGLMLGALARASAVLGEATYRAAAERNLAFLQRHLWDPSTSTLYHRWRDGERDKVQWLDSYAFLLAGTLDLYEATLEPRHLEFALPLAEGMLTRFYDPQAGAFWQTTPGASDVILRFKEDYDGAEPSGNAVATLALLKLGALADRAEFRAAAERTLHLFAERLQQLPQAVPCLLQALDSWLEEPRRVVLVGDPATPPLQALLRALHTVYLPHKVVLGQRGPVDPFARTLPARGEAVAYVCTGQACQPPVTDPESLQRLLRQM